MKDTHCAFIPFTAVNSFLIPTTSIFNLSSQHVASTRTLPSALEGALPSAKRMQQRQSPVMSLHSIRQTLPGEAYLESSAAELDNAQIPNCASSSNSPSFSSGTCHSATIHLVSFPPLLDDSPKLIKDIWKWKDIVLGDGRDYFVPRPRALKALSDVIVGSSHEGWVVEECAILSNCARMDILLSVNSCNRVSSQSTETSPVVIGKIVKEIVSSCIMHQLESFQSKRSQRSILVENISSFLDLPGMVEVEKTPIKCTTTTETATNYLALEPLLLHTHIQEDIVRHFCMVAAGLAPRPSRPNRSVVFRPFSSRDAHIMLQLKRTAQVAAPYRKVKLVLDAALSAGKAARNPEKCPALLQLKPFGGEGKYSQEAPLGLAREVAMSVVETVIEPMVKQTIERIQVLDRTQEIKSLREQAEAMIQRSGSCGGSESVKKRVQEILHEPTLRLREGKDVDVKQVLDHIQTIMANENH